MNEVVEVAIDGLSLQELETRKVELVEKLESIDVQLGDPNRINPDTQERMNGREWLEWRNRAKAAKRHVLKELRKVNQRLKEVKGIGEGNLSERLTQIEAKLEVILTLLGEK